MEDEAQKMVALKKAYADIILNTAKEAAARIMVSERKALRFQQDLSASRDEALRMLLRLKQMLDSKTTEAELKSLSQQRRIDELEAQLQEAEDVITDLRVELKRTGDELEKVKRNQVQAIIENVASAGHVTVETSDIKNFSVNQRDTDDNCCSTVKQTERLAGSDLNSFDPRKSVLASMVMRSEKKPELYRNGCTQRIRAFERNVLNGKLHPSEYEDDGNFPMENEYINEAPEKEVCNFSLKSAIIDMDKDVSQGERENPGKVRTFRKRKTRFGKAKLLRKCCHGQLLKSGTQCSASLHCKPSSIDGNDTNMTQTSDGMQENLQHDNKDGIKIFSKGKRKRNIKSWNGDGSSTSPSGQLSKLFQPSPVLSRCRTFAYLVDGGIKSAEDQSKTCANEPTVKVLPRMNKGLTLIKSDSDSITVSTTFSADVQAVDRSEPVQADSEKGVELVDKRVLVKQGSSDDVDDSRLSNSELKAEMTNVSLLNCGLDNIKASEGLNESPCKEVNSRLLKYTFQRKRKKEATSSPDEIASPEKISVMRKTAEEYTAPETQKSSLLDRSSRDSRRLAQVARQLISLSGRRWQ